jgi:hypothetical protein
MPGPGEHFTRMLVDHACQRRRRAGSNGEEFQGGAPTVEVCLPNPASSDIQMTVHPSPTAANITKGWAARRSCS